MNKLCDYISRYMGVLVLLLALVALLKPQPFLSVNTSVINPMLGIIMFGMGLTLTPHDFKIVLSRPTDILIGCIAQFTIMPITAWALATLFQLPKDLALGVILVGCCPGGTASNVITYLAKGDLALSVGMTAVSTILAPILTPTITWIMAGTFIHVDAIAMLMSIVYVVLLPIATGFIFQRFMPHFTAKITKYLPAFSSLMIALLVAIIVGHNANKLMSNGLLIIFVVMLHNVCGLSLGFITGKLMGLRYDKRIAVSIEVGMQNSGLASSLANIHFAVYPLATIPGAVFSVWHNISGALIAKYYQTQIKKHAST